VLTAVAPHSHATASTTAASASTAAVSPVTSASRIAAASVGNPACSQFSTATVIF
jgi:hypothetical protein